jgi:hypothetical protein
VSKEPEWLFAAVAPLSMLLQGEGIMPTLVEKPAFG